MSALPSKPDAGLAATREQVVAILELLETRMLWSTARPLISATGSFLELPDDEVDHYSRGEKVIHPEYGEPIDESEILVCFTPGVGLQQKAAR